MGVVGGSSRSGGQQSRLSPVPIIEFLGNEDASPSCPSVPPLLYYRSNSDSQLIFSRSDITRRDGPGGQNSMSLTAYSSVPSLIEYSKVHVPTYPKHCHHKNAMIFVGGGGGDSNCKLLATFKSLPPPIYHLRLTRVPSLFGSLM